MRALELCDYEFSPQQLTGLVEVPQKFVDRLPDLREMPPPNLRCAIKAYMLVAVADTAVMGYGHIAAVGGIAGNQSSNGYTPLRLWLPYSNCWTQYYTYRLRLVKNLFAPEFM